MPTANLKKWDGSEAGSIELPEALFAADQNPIVVRETLNAYLANQRQGTHSTRTRGMVRGGGRKPWKQKGTGRARQGSIRSPQWRGGAVAFGPQPRDHSQKINRRKRQAALRAVLSARFSEGNVHLLDNVDMDGKPSTKKVAALIEALGAEGRVLFVTSVDPGDTFLLSVRNIAHANVLPVNNLNVFDLLVSDSIVLTRAAVDALKEVVQA